MIKSIKVGRRAIDPQPGMIVWVNFFGEPRRHTVVSPITVNKHGYIIFTSRDASRFEPNRMVEKDHFPGDLGMPGYQYDSRPCTVFLSEITANLFGNSYDNWLKDNPPLDWGDFANG